MKQVVDYVTRVHGYSQRKACLLTRQHRSTQRKLLTGDPLTELRRRMHEIAATRIRYGYPSADRRMEHSPKGGACTSC